MADLAIVPWVPLNPHLGWIYNIVLRSTDDGSYGTPPWLKQIKKAVALAHLTMHALADFQSKMD